MCGLETVSVKDDSLYSLEVDSLEGEVVNDEQGVFLHREYKIAKLTILDWFESSDPDCYLDSIQFSDPNGLNIANYFFTTGDGDFGIYTNRISSTVDLSFSVAGLTIG